MFDIIEQIDTFLYIFPYKKKRVHHMLDIYHIPNIFKQQISNHI